jgi:hypothetical protein
MVTERDETDELSGEIDPVSVAITPLIEHIFTVTSTASPERQWALTEILTAAEKVRAALRPKPRLN